MKDLKTYINESTVTPIDDKVKELVGQVRYKYNIKNSSDKEYVIDAINNICNMCKQWKVPYPTIHDFVYDEDELENVQSKYSKSELRKVLIDSELLCVEINGYGYYKWDNAKKSWIWYQ